MNYKSSFTAILLGACARFLPKRTSRIELISRPYVVPISVSDFQGEVDSVLKFDLSVLGMEITSPDKAAYLVSGSQNGRLEGSLTAAGANQPLWARAYAGGVARSQAHAFANDIVKEIRGTAPIFQSKIAFRSKKAIRRKLPFRISTVTMPGVDARRHIGGRALLDSRRARIALHVLEKGGGEEILEHNLSTGGSARFCRLSGRQSQPGSLARRPKSGHDPEPERQPQSCGCATSTAAV
jgi:hypothetical protein